jgi:hypothetical protein
VALGVERMRYGFVACVIAILAAACSPGASTPQSTSPTDTSGYHVPDNVQYVDHWVPTSAVDLMSSDGTFIRAFAEADVLRIFNADDKKGSYPGFVQADRTKSFSGGSGMPVSGFAVHWVLQFSSQPDGTATADVCEISSITPDGPSPDPDVLKYTLTYHKTGEAPPANQQGPARAPATSVFGGWYATDYSGQSPATKQYLEPCLQSKPTVGPNPDNSPGWPAAPS